MAVRWVASLGQHDGQAVLLLRTCLFLPALVVLGQVGPISVVKSPYPCHWMSRRFG